MAGMLDLLALLLTAPPLVAEDYPIKTVSVDFLDNVQTTDRVWFYRNPDGSYRLSGGGTHPALEYNSESLVYPYVPVTHLRNVEPTYMLTIRNMEAVPTSGYVRVESMYLSNYTGNLFIAQSPDVGFDLQPNQTIQAITQLGAPMPDYLDEGNLSFIVKYFNSLHVEVSRSGLQFRVFTIPAAPIAQTNFMTQNWIPWTETLEFCTYAASRRTDPHEISYRVAGHLRISYFRYDIETAQLPSHWIEGGIYRLKDLINSGTKLGVCQDMSFLLALSLASVGISGEWIELAPLDQPDPNPVEGQQFVTNEALLAGFYSPFARAIFSMHQVVRVNGNAYDATLQIDSSRSWHPDPPQGLEHPVPLANYWQSFNYAVEDYLGLCLRYARFSEGERVEFDPYYHPLINEWIFGGEPVAPRIQIQQLKGLR